MKPIRNLLRTSFLVLAVWTPNARAQNLVPNPSFEAYDPCPVTYGNGGDLQCAPWVNGNQATSDYFNECASGTDVWVPDNLMGSQEAHTGQGYVGCFMREISIWREYITAPLTAPCVAGLVYEVSFYVSLADLYCGVENIGAYLSPQQPPTIGNIGTIPGAIPQVEANLGFISETNEWVLVTGCFTATGGEQWITIGNFYNNAQTPLEPGCSTSFASYYYIDDVSVVEGGQSNQLELELGDPVTTCTPFVIDPDVTGVDYLWSNGSTGSTLTVTESGTYSLTITAGCGNIGIDSVEVTFIGAPPVNLGPDVLNLCEGETFGVNLDPTAGEYLWNDGSTSSNRIINTSGVYSVTMDDGCDITSDIITISVIDGPEPFTLGDDTALCIGDEIVISFPPALGNFLWQDGSVSNSYTITTSGVYSLTISNACGSVSDQMLVTTGTAPHIDLGNPVVQFCENETVEINYQFNPLAGTYLWQDGSSSPDYSITSPGAYSVTFTNGCGSNSDQILVEVIETPEPISLGDDIILCEGEVVNFSFDPTLGNFLWQDGSSSPVYTISTGGNYGLTISNSCGSVSDEMAVTGLEMPVAELGPPEIMLCEGESLMLSPDPNAGEYLWHDGSTATSYLVQDPGIYAVTVSNACGSASDMVEVSEELQLVFELGDDMVLCPQQLPFTLDVADIPGATSYLWQDNSTAPDMHVSEGGLYAVTVSNSCFSVTDEIWIVIEEGSPVVVLPPDVTMCEGENLLLDGNNITGDYTWQDGSDGETFKVQQSGTYALTITNQCGSGSDMIQVTFMDTLARPDLGPDISLCPGETFVLHVNIPGANYLWQDLSTADSIVINSEGTYFLNVFNTCSSQSDTVEVAIDGSPPVIDLPASMLICNGEKVIINGGVGGVNYLWSTGAMSSSIEVNAQGIYGVTISNSCGTATDAIEVVDGGDAPFVSLGPDLSICEGEGITLSPSGAYIDSWLWQDSSANATYQVTTAGEITVNVSNQCGSAADTMIVYELPELPMVDLGSDTSLCEGEILTLAISLPDVDVDWSDGSTGSSIDVNAHGVYYVTISNQCGAQTDSIEIGLLPAAPVLSLGIDQTLCPGEEIIIEPGLLNVDYIWQDGSTGNLFIATVPGLVALTVSNQCGFDTDSILILEDTQGPDVDLGEDISACEGDTVTLDAGVLGVNYLWQDGNTSSELHVTVPGLYVLQVSNACGADADSVQVNFDHANPNASLSGDTVLCDGEMLQVNANANPGTLITWHDGSSNPVFEVNTETQVILQLTNECGEDIDTMLIQFEAKPLPFDLGSDTVLCPDEIIILQAPVTMDLLTWQDGSHGSVLIAEAGGLYTLEISNKCGVTTDEIRIIIDDKVPFINSEELTIPCDGSDILIDASQQTEAQYLWNTGDNLPALTVNTPGIYSVTITTACELVAGDIEVMAPDCAGENIFIPNVFSPNGDRVNDEFKVFIDATEEISNFSCDIYDRWGNQVYETHDADFTWNGRFKEQNVSPGVYVYVISVEFQSSKVVNRYAGDVTIIR